MSSPTTLPPRSSPADRRASSPAAHPVPPESQATPWGLSRGDRWFLSVMLAVLAGLLSLHVSRDVQRQAAPVTIVHAGQPVDYVFRLDPNTATWVEWTQLDGIGPTLAKRIVEHRATNGPFRTLEDLRRVKGIGVKTLDKVRPHLTFAEAE